MALCLNLARPADSYPTLLDNPQRLRNGVSVKCQEHLADQAEDLVAVRLSWTNDDDSRGLVWRIGADIGEVEIQRQEYPALALALQIHASVRLAHEALVEYGVTLVTAGMEDVSGFDGEVLIDLAAHGQPSRRQGDHAFLREVRRVRESGLDGLRCQAGIAAEDLLSGESRGEVGQHHRNGNPRA